MVGAATGPGRPPLVESWLHPHDAPTPSQASTRGASLEAAHRDSPTNATSGGRKYRRAEGGAPGFEPAIRPCRCVRPRPRRPKRPRHGKTWDASDDASGTTAVPRDTEWRSGV